MNAEQTAAKVEVRLARAEKALAEAAGELANIGVMLHGQAKADNLSAFTTALDRAAHGTAQAGIGNALASVVAFHKQIALSDPRPQARDGGGK